VIGVASDALQVKEKQEVEPKGELTQTRPVFVPAVDICEAENELVLMADMPGVKNDDVEIHLEENQLTIRGRVLEEPRRTTPVYTEYRTGDYYRKFTVSNIIDQSRIEANMKDGVLRVTLPKAEAAKPRQIKVSSA
jgi:HSP20 family protein